MTEALSTELLITRGRDAYAQNDYASALADLREVVRRHPAYADVHHLIGLCLSLLGRPEDAVEAFARALEINPRYVEALINQAITLNEIGRYDEARAAFEAAAEIDLEDGVGRFPSVLAGRLANHHMQLGDLYTEGKALEEAVEQYRKAADLRPRFVDVRFRLARALLDLGDVDAAIRELSEIVEINPNFVTARINLGLAWYRKGDRAAARREWELAARQRPGDAQVEYYLRMLGGS